MTVKHKTMALHTLSHLQSSHNAQSVRSSWYCSSLFADEDGTVSPPSETSEDTTSSEDTPTKCKNEITEETDANAASSAQGGENSENVLVIDTTFTCKIHAPGLDPFEIKVIN